MHLVKLVFWDPFLSLLLHFACPVQISVACLPASSDQYQNHFGYVLVLLPSNRADQGITSVHKVRECTLQFTLFHPSSSFSTLVCSRVHAADLQCAHVHWTSVLMDREAVALGAEIHNARLIEEGDRCREILVFTYTILFFTRRPPSTFSAPGKVCSSISSYR